MIIHREYAQQSIPWVRARAAIPTSSEADRIFTPGGKPSKQATAYMNRKLAEWAFGEPIFDDIKSDYMERGTQLEPEARAAFMLQTGIEVEEIGFVTTDNEMFGTSPDGLLCGQRPGTVQLKAPAAQTQIGYLLNPQSLLDQYAYQMHAELWTFGQPANFQQFICSYHPKLPLVIVEFFPDEKWMDAWDKCIRAFIRTMGEARIILAENYGVPLAKLEDWGKEKATSEHAILNEPFWSPEDCQAFMASKGAL